MFCNYCGAPNPNDASFCSACGKGITAPAQPPVQKEIAQRALSNSEGSGGTSGQDHLRASLPGLPQIHPQPQPEPPAVAGKGKVGLWILVGFAACLILVIAAALGLRQNQTPSGRDTPAVIPDSAPLPDNPPAPAPAPADTPANPAPVPTPTPPAPAAAPQNPIVGDWKTTTVIGDTHLIFTDDGRYSIKSALVGDKGVYVYGSDGTLRLQPDAIFSHDIVIWHCQLSGDSMSVVDPDGAGHVYTRVRE